MLDRLDHLRRLVGTALSFSLFGLGGLVVGLVIAPLIWVVIRQPAVRERTMRRVIGHAFRGFVGTMRLFGVLDYDIRGLEPGSVPPRTLIVANHPSLIDVVFLLAIFPDADCVVKASHWSNPFTRAAVRAAKYIPNSDPVEVIEQCVARLNEGRQLVLFPEGTRTAPNETAEFNRGAASIALRAGENCLPVRLSCIPTTLTKADRWYDIPPRKVYFEVRVLDLLAAGDYLANSTPERLASRKLNAELLDLLNGRTNGAAYPAESQPVVS